MKLQTYLVQHLFIKTKAPPISMKNCFLDYRIYDVKLYIFHEVKEERVRSLFWLDIVYLKTIVLIHLAYVKTSTSNKVNG
jgi:hypothetical protein